jgi:uncharacterized protein
VKPALATLAALLAATAAFALDTSRLHPSGYVTDFAHVLSPSAELALEDYCAALERRTGAQVAVILLESLEGHPIEDLANRLYRQWGIGHKETAEGLLLLLAIRDRKQRAEVGYGLEPVIPDGFAGGVLRGIRPILRQGDYGGALLAAVQQFGQRIAAAKGVDLSSGAPRPRPQPGPAAEFPWPLVPMLVIFALAMIGRRRGRRRRGGFLPGLFLGSLVGHRRGYGGSGWSGGGFGDYDGGGGFGGFGGGDSGGGGASSGW